MEWGLNYWTEIPKRNKIFFPLAGQTNSFCLFWFYVKCWIWLSEQFKFTFKVWIRGLGVFFLCKRGQIVVVVVVVVVGVRPLYCINNLLLWFELSAVKSSLDSCHLSRFFSCIHPFIDFTIEKNHDNVLFRESIYSVSNRASDEFLF